MADIAEKMEQVEVSEKPKREKKEKAPKEPKAPKPPQGEGAWRRARPIFAALFPLPRARRSDVAHPAPMGAFDRIKHILTDDAAHGAPALAIRNL